MVQDLTTVVLTLDSYRFSTRARKASLQYRKYGQTTFLGTSGVGRTGRWDVPCDRREDDLRLIQIPVRRPYVDPGNISRLLNLFMAYVPAAVRITWHVLRLPAQVVHVTGAHLLPFGLLHRLRHKSLVVLDVQERPGMVSAKGSLTSLFSPFEPFILRYARRHVNVVTVVTQADITIMRSLGYAEIVLVRNAPIRDWRAPYCEPPSAADGGLIAAAIGTIFEGRGFEVLLQAVAECRRFGHNVALRIYGPGRPSYIDELVSQSRRLGIDDLVHWMGPISSGEVSAAYLDAQIGLVLYESTDPGNDGLSNKILECVASGRPVVAGDLSENRRFVSENRVGWLTNVDAPSVAQALRGIVVDAGFVQMCARCRTFGDTWLNWESEFSRLTSVLAARPLADR